MSSVSLDSSLFLPQPTALGTAFSMHTTSTDHESIRLNLITTPLQGASHSPAVLTVQHSESAPSLDDAQQRVLNERSRPRNQVTIRYRQR